MPPGRPYPPQVIIRIQVDPVSLERLKDKIKSVEKGLASTVKVVGDIARDLWIQSAEENLKSSQNYITAVEKGVIYPAENDLTYIIYPRFKESIQSLNQKDVGILLEYGYEPFDMKERFLKGKDKLIINFEYSSPGKGDNRELPIDMHNIAAKNSFFQEYAFTEKRFPEIFGAGVPKNFANEKLKKRFSPLNVSPYIKSYNNDLQIRFEKGMNAYDMQYSQPGHLSIDYTWKRGRLAGMKANKRKSVGNYSLFRTMSIKSASDSWIHPGLRPKTIFKTMTDKIRPIAKEHFQKVFDAILQS